MFLIVGTLTIGLGFEDGYYERLKLSVAVLGYEHYWRMAIDNDGA